MCYIIPRKYTRLHFGSLHLFIHRTLPILNQHDKIDTTIRTVIVAQKSLELRPKREKLSCEFQNRTQLLAVRLRPVSTTSVEKSILCFFY